MSRLATLALWLPIVASCADTTPSAPPPSGDDADSGDLGLGDVQNDDDGKADGGDPTWGHALECKPAPVLPALVAPKITLSVDGLTLHLTDAATGYDKVFPVGPGEIDHATTDREFGESLSYEPVLATGTHDFAITPGSIQTCKTWWTDPDTGAKSPVFAGLPFMSWHGNYAIHGPIDNYRAANGGSLRRGFVSHGCFRMEAADILEIYARIHTVAKTPVHVQREVERRADGSRVDVAPAWIGTQCSADADCNFTDGFCAKDAYSERGTCSAHCTTYCADKAGRPSTFCVNDPDPDHAGQGMCVAKVSEVDYECRPYEAMSVHKAVARHGQPTVKADVCLPGSHGWVGDRCAGAADCGNGTTCGADGTCTMACAKYCSDLPGYSDTFCSAATTGTGGTCERACTPASNASECDTDEACVATHRPGETAVHYVCRP